MFPSAFSWRGGSTSLSEYVLSAQPSLRFASRVVPASLLAWCAACSTWNAPYTEPSAIGPATTLARARVTLHDGRSLTFFDARVRHDSVVGQVRRAGSFQPAGVSRNEIRAIQLPEFDALRTFALVGAVVSGISGRSPVAFARA